MPSKKHQSPIESNSAFMVKIEDLIREIVIQNSIPYYRIESRMEHLSIEAESEEIYLPVIRIVTYFEDTVSQISDIIRDEFDIAIEKSIDKKKTHLDSFSYKHVQYIAGLKENRKQLTEYKRSGEKKFEIQVCSMLQDAWTGIEKELGYDDATFPEETKRDFYRVGALLEMADIEFCKIRSILAARMPADARNERPGLLVVNETKKIAEQVHTGTFSDYLHAVAHDAPAEHVAAPEIYSIAAPVYESVSIPEPVSEPVFAAAESTVSEPELPVFDESFYTPPVAAEPVIAQQPAAAAQPAPAETAPKAAVFALKLPSLAPVRAIPAKKPAGLAPRSVNAPVVDLTEPVAAPQPAPSKPNIININRVDIPREAEQKVAAAVNQATQVFRSEPVRSEPVAAPQPAVVYTPAPVPPPIPEPRYIPEPMPVAERVASEPARTIPIPAPEPRQEPMVAASNNGNNNGNGGYDFRPAATATVAPAAMAAQQPEAAQQPAAPQPVAAPQVAAAPLRVAEMIREPEKVAERAVAAVEEDTMQARSPLLDENAPINDASLREFVMSSKLVKEVDQKIAERAGAKINSEIDIEGDVERLRFLKVFTLKQLNDRIMDNKNDIVAFAEKWIGKDNGGSFDSGISLFYLEYLLVGKKNDPAFAIEYVVKFISDNDYSARYIIPTYNSIKNTEVSNFSHLTLKV